MSHQERSGREISHAAQGAFVILAILFAAFMFAVGLYVGQNSEPEGQAAQTTATGGQPTSEEETATEGETETATETETEGDGGGGDVEQGGQVFASAGCANCHTLEEANASGSVGPNLDDTSLDREGIEEVVRNGRGAMPSFEGSLEDEQLEAVADFVAASAGS